MTYHGNRGWDIALDAQNDLVRSLQTAEGIRFLRWYATGASEGAHYDLDTEEVVKGRLDPEGFHRFVMAAAGVVAKCEPVWVAEDVLELVEVAAETFEPEAIYPDDLFIPNAFCYFPRPLYSVDIAERRISFRAVSWARYHDPENPGAAGVVISLWTHDRDEDAYSGKWGMIGGSHLTMLHSGGFPFGEKRIMSEPTNHTLFKQLQVLWRLAQQQIVVSGREAVSRAVWRRKSNWRQIKHVQVLTLRRATSHRSDTDGPGREYSHRWLVHGHWRNQWYPSQKRHYQIWIGDYVKGPDDKPFVPKRRAVDFIR